MRRELTAFLDRIYILPGESSRFHAMEGLRGYAVFLIFCTHFFNEYAMKYRHFNYNLTRPASLVDAILFYLIKSHYGVDIFFLLSGFLIFRILKKNKTDFSYFNFLKKRILRIYPAFLISLIVCTYAYAFQTKCVQFNALMFIENIFFLNAVNELHIDTYNPVTWSLFYEFVFYITIPAILLFKKYDIWSSKKSFIIFYLITSFFILLTDYPRFMMFFPGAFLALSDNQSLNNISLKIPEPAVILLYLLSTAWFAYSPFNFKIFTPIFTITASLLFIKTCFSDGFLNKIFSLKPIRYLGNISYSFYLIHVLCVATVFYLSPLSVSINPVFSVIFLFSLSFILSVFVSTLLFHFVEKIYFIHSRNLVKA